MQRTKIGWCDFSCNPIKARHRETDRRGHMCVMVSTGCLNCYASKINQRFGTGLPFRQRDLEQIEFVLDPKELHELRKLTWGRVFIEDMSDLFGEWIPDSWLDTIFTILEDNPRIRPIVLTKRPERMCVYLQRRWGTTPPAHMMIGTSIENQKVLPARLTDLLRTPACWRLISAEPLLSALQFPTIIGEYGAPQIGIAKLPQAGDEASPTVHWVITGGESSAGARYCDIQWITHLNAQLMLTPTAFFVKQLGTVWARTHRTYGGEFGGKGEEIWRWPESLRVQQLPPGWLPSSMIQEHATELFS